MVKKIVKYVISLCVVALAIYVAASFLKKNETQTNVLNQDGQISYSELAEEEPLFNQETEDFQESAEDAAPESLPPLHLVESDEVKNQTEDFQTSTLDEDGFYYSKDDVALYIHTYKKLPENFITKSQAEKLGWGGGTPLYEVADGMCIGGDRFYNREGVLPKKSGRTYTECDIDTLNKKSRGKKRIVFSNDGLIFYTDNHYESFVLLYGDE